MGERKRVSDEHLKLAEKFYVRIKAGRKSVMGYDLWCLVEELSLRDPSLLEVDHQGKTKLFKVRERVNKSKI